MVRAALMASAVLAGRALELDTDASNLLGLAALAAPRRPARGRRGRGLPALVRGDARHPRARVSPDPRRPPPAAAGGSRGRGFHRGAVRPRPGARGAVPPPRARLRAAQRRGGAALGGGAAGRRRGPGRRALRPRGGTGGRRRGVGGGAGAAPVGRPRRPRALAGPARPVAVVPGAGPLRGRSRVPLPRAAGERPRPPGSVPPGARRGALPGAGRRAAPPHGDRRRSGGQPPPPLATGTSDPGRRRGLARRPLRPRRETGGPGAVAPRRAIGSTPSW